MEVWSAHTSNFSDVPLYPKQAAIIAAYEDRAVWIQNVGARRLKLGFVSGVKACLFQLWYFGSAVRAGLGELSD